MPAHRRAHRSTLGQKGGVNVEHPSYGNTWKIYYRQTWADTALPLTAPKEGNMERQESTRSHAGVLPLAAFCCY